MLHNRQIQYFSNQERIHYYLEYDTVMCNSVGILVHQRLKVICEMTQVNGSDSW